MRYLFLFFLSVVLLSAIGLPRAFGQALYVGTDQVVAIRPNTRVAVGGTLRNRGTLINQGTLRVSGDWRNEATYTDGPGSEVILVGAEQTIDHRGQAFHHLSVRGSGNKELRSALRVVDTLTLERGVLQSSAATPLELAATAAVAGGSSESFVESLMIYSGTGRRRFPLGLAGAYLPLTLTNVVGNNPALRVSVVAPNPAASIDESLARISSARYWRIETVSGTFTGSPVELTVDRDDGLDDLVGVVVAQSDEPGGPFASVGQSDRSGDVTQGTVTSEEQVNQSVVAGGGHQFVFRRKPGTRPLRLCAGRSESDQPFGEDLRQHVAPRILSFPYF